MTKRLPAKLIKKDHVNLGELVQKTGGKDMEEIEQPQKKLETMFILT